MSNDQSPNRDRAALAFIALMTAAAIGVAWIIRSPAGDPNHLVGGYNASPDAAPNLCWHGLVRGPSEIWTQLGLDKIDGGDSIALAKSCFHVPPECLAVDGGVLVLRDAGTDPAPCVTTDAGLYCPDASTPWAVYEDICATDVQILPSGIEWTSADEWFRPYIPGEPVFEVWSNGHPQAPWQCACGAAGARLDAGACETFEPLYGKQKVDITTWEGQTLKVYPRLDGGVWTAVPRERLHETRRPGEWRGNCVRMPCSSWGEPEALPPACRVAECDDRPCGRGRGGKCGEDFSTDDAGQPITCVGNQWARECDPDWECGPGKWAASCGQCPVGSTCKGHKCKLDRDPDAGG